jgi:tyrosyl-tRNA synthetase
LRWRGLIHQTTDDAGLAAALAARRWTVYAGFDPTAESLHVGSLMPLLALRRFQKAGHAPIALLGGATGMIGDPSGKSKERNLLSMEQLQHNQQGIDRQIRSILDDSGTHAARVVNNLDWTAPWSYLEFLRDVGKHFPLSLMLAKDSVSTRLAREESGISYTEFSYMLLQAYDFVHLRRAYGCELQIGGSDQWGNITAGIELGRRMYSQTLYGITFPLLLTSEGQKMGKTEKGTIWLAADKTSPYQFYQYWINVADMDAGMCLRFLTELDRDEIQALDASRQSHPEQRQSQQRLAECLTQTIHGESGLSAARQATRILFGGEIQGLPERELLEIFADVPSKSVARSLLDSGWGLVEALVESGLSKSRGEARRTIEQGGAYINNRRCTDTARKLESDDLAGPTVLVLRTGKKNYALLRFDASSPPPAP